MLDTSPQMQLFLVDAPSFVQQCVVHENPYWSLSSAQSVAAYSSKVPRVHRTTYSTCRIVAREPFSGIVGPCAVIYSIHGDTVLDPQGEWPPKDLGGPGENPAHGI